MYSASGSRLGTVNSVSDSEYTGSNSENASNNAKKYFHLIYSSYFISNFQAYVTKYINMETIIDGYRFIVEEKNANNIILEKDTDGGNIIDAIKKFIIFLHKNKIQYVTIYDCKKRDRYKNILLYIYKNANNTEKWLYDMATFIYDGDVIRCRIY